MNEMNFPRPLMVKQDIVRVFKRDKRRGRGKGMEGKIWQLLIYQALDNSSGFYH